VVEIIRRGFHRNAREYKRFVVGAAGCGGAIKYHKERFFMGISAIGFSATSTTMRAHKERLVEETLENKGEQ
jgi:hypothetical protein